MKNRLTRWLHLAVALSLAMIPVKAGYAAAAADTIYMGGTIYTMTETYEEALDDSKAKKVEAVATKDGKIVFAGSWTDAQAQYQGSATKIVDLKGKTMLPGFVDAHGHFHDQGTADLYEVNLNSPPLGSMNSIEDYIAALKARAEVTPPGEWVVGWGYDDTLIKDMRHPTAADLDKVSTQHPIYIAHISKHMGVANSLAMQESDIKNNPNYASEVAAGNVPLDADGNPTGFLRETKAMSLIVRPGKTAEQGYRGIQRGADIYAANGVTTADQGASFLTGPGDGITQYQSMIRRGTLPLRVVIHPLGRYGSPDYAPMVRAALGWSGTDTVNGITFANAVPGANSPAMGADISNYRLSGSSRIDSGLLWLGSWKLIFDGSNQGYTGWFKTPGYYAPPEGSGREYHAFEALNFLPKEMQATLTLLHKNNQSVEVHGNGNAAIESIVTGFEEAVAAYPTIKDRRHTIIHSQMAERQHVERMMGNYENLKPELASMYGYPGDEGLPDDAYMLTGTYLNGQRNTDLINKLGNGQLMRDQNLVNSYYVAHTYFWGDRHRDIFMGPGRAKNISPAQWSIYNRNIFNYHSDTPVVPMEPLRSLQSGVSRVSSNGNGIFHTGKDYHGTINLPETEGGAIKPFWDYDQRVNRLMALKALTANAAFPNFLEGKLGAIKPNAYADFTILDSDPMSTPELQLASIRVATTIVNDNVVHGYLPGATDYTGRVAGSYTQSDSTSVVTVDAANQYSKDEARNAGYALPDGQVFYTIKDFKGTLAGDSANAVFQFQMFGNGKNASTFTLHSLDGGGAYRYGRPSPGEFPAADGAWWLAPLSDPNVVIGADETLRNLTPYVAHFIMKDNGAFDQDNTKGSLEGAIALTADAAPQDGSSGNNGGGGGGGGGCSVGGNGPGLELLLAFAALTVLMIRRRMKN